MKRFDGTIGHSLYSRKPPHPNQHTQEELPLIKRIHSKFKPSRLSQVYVEEKSVVINVYGSMCPTNKVYHIKEKKVIKSVPKAEVELQITVTYPGEKVQIVYKILASLEEFGLFQHKGKSYYQLTAIDEFSRKGIAKKLLDEKSVTTTSQFLLNLEAKIGFPPSYNTNR